MIESFKLLYRYRALLQALVVRHLAVRYRGSVLGFLWTLLNPLCLMLIYTLVFSYYARIDAVANYPVFVFCGLLPWLWTASAVNEGTAAIVSSGHLITKSMFPPLILPFVALLTSLVNFLLALPVLFVLMLLLGAGLKLTLLLLPFLIVLQGLLLWGLVLGLAALNVHYRDVQHLVGNVLTFLFFLCPIVYPANLVPARLHFTLEINPFALITLMYHDLILNETLPAVRSLVVLLGFILIFLVLGSWIYGRHRESFAEAL